MSQLKMRQIPLIQFPMPNSPAQDKYKSYSY